MKRKRLLSLYDEHVKQIRDFYRQKWATEEGAEVRRQQIRENFLWRLTVALRLARRDKKLSTHANRQGKESVVK